MKLSANTLKLALATALVVSCAPNAKQLKEAIEKDPSIVFAAIEKAPDKFIEVVMKAQQDAQKVAGEKAQEDEKKQRDEEFKNPLKPEIDETRVIFGPKTAPITIVEFSDFQCPYCSRGFQTVKEVQKMYGDKVRVLFKHLPLDFHPLAMPAAKYYEALSLQDHSKAEKFHDGITERGQKHLIEMMTLMKQGHICEIIYTVQRSDVDNFRPCETMDPDYAKLFYKAVKEGLIVTPLVVKFDQNEICLTSKQLKVL